MRSTLAPGGSAEMTATKSRGSVVSNVVEATTKPIRVAVICDFPEERWPSMDLVGDMLCDNLTRHHSRDVQATVIRPRMPFTRKGVAGTLSRVYGRYFYYPRKIRNRRERFDLYHIVDHSYAHLAHELPPERTIITCHDMDAFRCLIDPSSEHRSWAFRAMTRQILAGMQRAGRVTCDTAATRDALLAHGLLSEAKLSVIHNGVHPALGPQPDKSDKSLSRLLGRRVGAVPELLHVGSTIRRKRIDILLKVLAEVRQRRSDVRLLRVGGEFTSEQKCLAKSFGLSEYIDVLPRIAEATLGAAYRRASVVLQTSEAEGFGLPVIEAMACGTPVIASAIPALREVGGKETTYCVVDDVGALASQVLALLSERDTNPTAWSARSWRVIQHASNFTWNSYAEKMVNLYKEVLSR